MTAHADTIFTNHERPAWLTDFTPRRFLSNGHLQTIFGNYLPRQNTLPPPEAELVEVEPATSDNIASQVLCHSHWQPLEVRAARTTVILLHGLEGSSNSQYIVGNANKLFRAGCNVVRMNMRNCGGTEALTPTLYHSGRSGDVLAVAKHFIRTQGLKKIALAGYSMGGNMVLKCAGELGNSGPPEICAAIGVSPAIDLAASADALHDIPNRIYELRFLRGLMRRLERKAALFPHIYTTHDLPSVRSIRAFDDHIQSRYSGFQSADDYYHRAAAARVIGSIAIPTLILHALDDPFIRLTPETRADLAANTHITFVETQHGGHCAFLAQPTPANDGYWAERTLLHFLAATLHI